MEYVFCTMVPVSDSISVGDALSLYSHVFCMMMQVSGSIACFRLKRALLLYTDATLQGKK